MKLKPLEWAPDREGNGFIAVTIIGQFAVFDDCDPRWAFHGPWDSGYRYFHTETFEQAKVDAASFYKRNMENAYLPDEGPEQYAVIDPNWGEPKVIINTISDSLEGAKSRAVNLEDLSLYSGAEFYVAGHKSGSWEKLESHGYEVRQIRFDILDNNDE